MYKSTAPTFGVMVKSLHIDQPSYTIIEELNKLRGYSPVVFFLDYAPTLQTLLFAKMPMKYAVYFQNPVISTCLETTKILQRVVGPTKKLVYLWNLDWLYSHNTEKEYREIYGDPSLNFIVRCHRHAQTLNKCWLISPERISIVEDFNCEKITRLF